MSVPDIPSFEDWRNYCFTRARAECWSENPGVRAVADRFTLLPPWTLAEYLIRLFQNAAELHPRFTPDRIAEATWFIFGIGSEYFARICRDEVSRETQALVYRSMLRMYTDLYDRLCTPCGGHNAHGAPLDIAVLMIWDMDSTEVELKSREPSPVIDAAFETLRAILERCTAQACLKSALHAMGTVRNFHAARVDAMIDDFLHLRGGQLPRSIHEYAAQARLGHV